jgi:phosphate transport system substrate-binding protein
MLMLPRRFHSAVALATALVLACIGAPAGAATDQLIWRGDQATGRSIMQDLAKEYAKQKKGKIELQPFSTLSGLDAVASGAADIAGSARGKYARRAEEANINFVPVALDAAVPITHPKNPVGSLSLRQIHDIYYGRITNWKELGGNDAPINLYAIAAPLDGVEFSLRELVFRNGGQPVAAPRLYLNTVKLEEAITLDPSGLGLSTLATTHGNKGLKPLKVGGIAASTATVADGSYPLYITLYLANLEGSPKQDAVMRFLAFLETPAAKDILRRHQLTPYADSGDAIARNEQRMAYIDAQIGRDGKTAAIATAHTPVSAPRATLEARSRIAPTSASTQAARENLVRAEEKNKTEAAAKPATAPVKKAVASAPKKAATAPAKKVAVAKAAPAKKKTAVAKATPPKPAAKAQPKATAKAEAPAKPAASFGNVSGGADSN